MTPRDKLTALLGGALGFVALYLFVFVVLLLGPSAPLGGR